MRASEEETAGATTSKRGWRMAACFAPIGVGTAVAALWNPFWEHSLALLITVAVASAFWGLAVHWSSKPALATRWIVLGAIVLRLVALLGDPGLSDDVNRYVWEGSLVADGISPYAAPPDAPEHAARRQQFSKVYSDLNNPEISAAYPPVIEEVFGLLTWGSRLFGDTDGRLTLLWMRAFFALCDLLVLWPLAHLLARFQRPQSALVAWAWCPLVALEFGGSGHFDSLGILMMMGALALFSSSASHWKDGLGAVLASASVFVKLLPLCMVPFVLRGERRVLRAGVLVVASLLWFLPFAYWEDGGASVGRGITEYGTRWEGFNFVYSWIESGVKSLFGGAQDRSITDPRIVGRALVALIWCSWLGVLYFKKREPVRAVGELIALFLVLSPTLHPWYLVWVLPFVALRPSWAWTWVLGTGFFLYAPLARWNSEAVWEISAWTWPLVALPFCIALVVPIAFGSDSREDLSR